MKNNRPFRPLDDSDSSDVDRVPVGCLISFVVGVAAVTFIISKIVYHFLP